MICILSHGGRGLILINVCRIGELKFSFIRASVSKCLIFLGCFVSEGPTIIRNIILLSGRNYSFIHYTSVFIGKVLVIKFSLSDEWRTDS